MDEQRLLTAYCFLSSLTENNSDLYNDVFIPVMKRTLSSFSLISQKTYGIDADIQKHLSDLYGINIPIFMIRSLLKSTEAKMSKRERGSSGFRILEGGKCFEIQKYAFIQLENKYKEGLRNASTLQKAFEEFNKDIELKEYIPSFSDFITQNRNKISMFFSGQPIENKNEFEESFIYHVDFLEYIEANSHPLFEIAESIYLGSIVASYFESNVDFNAKFANDEIYYLDTQIILKALDLQNESETQPIKELLNLIQDTGGKLKVLNITYDEISYHIENTISSFNSQNPSTTINDACVRRGLNKTWLIGINGKLEKYIEEQLKATRETISDDNIKKYLKSPDVKELQHLRKKQANAEHDVIAYLWVREKRGAIISTPQKAKYWFVSANKNLLNFNLKRGSPGKIAEITLPHTLTSLLWLKNPRKLISKVKEIGLNELMATTLREEIATKELIIEFDQNIRNTKEIDQDAYKTLLSSIAYQSAKKIEKLNLLVYEGKKDEFYKEAIKLVESERKRRAGVQDTIRRTIKERHSTNQENEELRKRIEELEKSLKAAKKDSTETKTELESLANTVDKRLSSVKRLVVFLIATIVIAIALFLINRFDLFTAIKSLINWIVGIGGLWTFLNFLLNLAKSIGIIK
jgi:hypothetical protein